MTRIASAWLLLEAAAIARASADPFAILSVGSFPASAETRYILDVIARWPMLAKECLAGIVGIELEFDLVTQAISQRFAQDVFDLCELATASLPVANAA